VATFQVENSASCSLKSPNVFECGRRPGAFLTDRNAHPRWDTGIYWKCFKKRVTAVCFVRNFALSRRSCSFGVKLCRKAELKVHVFSLFFTLGFWGCESSNC